MNKQHDTLATYRKFLNLIIQTDDIIVLFDSDKRIVEVNDRGAKAYGYQRQELLQMEMTDLVAYDCAPIALSQMQLLSGQSSIVFEKAHRRKDGSIFAAEINISAIDLAGTQYYQAVVRDITKRKEDEARLQLRNEILKLFAQNISLTEYIRANVEVVRQWLGCAYVGMQVLNECGGIMTEYHHSAPGFDGFNAPYHSLMQAMADLSAQDQSAPENQLGRRPGVTSFEVLPIVYDGERLGTFFLAGTKQKQLHQQKINYFKAVIAVIVGERLYRFKLEEKIKRNYEVQMVVNELLSLPLIALSLNELLHKTLDLLLSMQWLALEPKGCVFLVEGQPPALVLKAWRGLDQQQQKKCARLPLGQCVCGLAASTGQIQFTSGLDDQHQAHCPSIPAHGHYCVPILSGKRVLGVITLYLKAGYCRNVLEEECIGTVAKTLAGVMERIKDKEKLIASQRQLYNIIEFLPDATFVLDGDRKVIAWNKAMEQMTGTSKGEVLGRGGYLYLPPFYKTPNLSLAEQFFIEEKTDQSKMRNSSVRPVPKGPLRSKMFLSCLHQGAGAYVEVMAAPLYDEHQRLAGAIETIRDISEHKRMESQLQHLVEYDALTNIPNRYVLEQQLQQIEAKASPEHAYALLLIGVDNFKLVNDALGHSMGDEMLVKLTDVLKENITEKDLLFRFGGDEFAVLLGETGQHRGLVLSEKLRLAVEKGVLCYDDQQACFHFSISIGVVMVDGTLDVQKLLVLADTALYTAKKEGKNRVVFLPFDEQIEIKPTETNQMIGLIKDALRDNMFMLYYQPVVRMEDSQVIHHEVLLRLKDHDQQIVTPGRFIPVAERFGLMPQIDRWVVETTLQALKEDINLRVFVNLSGATLGEEKLLDYIEELIVKSSIDPTRIGFEVTETAAVRDLTRVRQWILRVKALGCSFALDDFGVGFSSFAYLRTLPVDFLKIDGSFVRNIDVDPNQQALVQAMHDVARALGKKTIVEFVENAAILNMTRQMGVHYGQGYYFGKPMPL